MKICGVDYGSKMAGTTVICYYDTITQQLSLEGSEKKKDADAFLKKSIDVHKPSYVFIDAPLSLPLVYQDRAGYTDFFFRKVDREVQGMSPLFLGGLTARAMKLAYDLKPLSFYETYPAAQSQRMNLKSLGYKTKVAQIAPVLAEINQQYPAFTIPTIKNWHEVDALLALIGAYRFWKEEHKVLGDVEEGLVYL
ncbi:hypothetical protein BKI52_29160 [marine bacterium AO1-C]|nr:hypothetical protein BKI52_29160 [marine bacterium AO1-C]